MGLGQEEALQHWALVSDRGVGTDQYTHLTTWSTSVFLTGLDIAVVSVTAVRLPPFQATLGPPHTHVRLQPAHGVLTVGRGTNQPRGCLLGGQPSPGGAL